MHVTPTSAESATNHDDPRRANLAQIDPSYSPTTRGRATHSSNACPSGSPAGKASTCPARATDTHGVEASLSSQWCWTRKKPEQPPLTSPGRGPHFPDTRDPPATEKGAAPHTDPSSHLTLLSLVTDPRGPGQRGQPNSGAHGLADDHRSVIEHRDPPDPGPCARTVQCPPQLPCATREKPPRALSRTPPQDLRRRCTAAYARRESRTGHAQGRRQHDCRGITSSHQRAGRWTSH